MRPARDFLRSSVAVVILALMTTSCFLSALFESGNTKMTFSIDTTAASPAGSARGTAGGTGAMLPNEIIWMDITEPEATLSHALLTSGQNELTLSKDGIHLVGFVYNPASARSLPTAAGRTITTGAMTMGSLQIVAAGLESVPLSASAGDEVSLGMLSGTATGFGSGITMDQASSGLGYDAATLASFGVFDSSLSKLLNPDVDRDGVHDSDEGLAWMITSMRYVTFLAGNVFSDFSVQKPVSEFLYDLRQFTMVFWLNNAFPHPPVTQAMLTLPPDLAYHDFSNNQVFSIPAFHDSMGEGGGIYSQYYFNFSDRIQDPEPPFDGSYSLALEGSTYYWDGLSFLKPTAESIEGFVFPATLVSYNADGTIQTISWRWKAVHGNSYIDAGEDEVRLKVREFYYYLGTDGGSSTVRVDALGVPYYKSGTITVSSYRLTPVSLNGRLDCDYWDRAGNDYKFENRL